MSGSNAQLIGQTCSDNHWQAKENTGFAAADFEIDWMCAPLTFVVHATWVLPKHIYNICYRLLG